MHDRYTASLDPEIIANPPLRRPPGRTQSSLPLHQEPGLASLQAPVLFVWGEDDAMQPIECLQSFAAIPRQEHLILPQCGHWPHREYPDALHQNAISFMRTSSYQETR